mmetsp:Transcript_46299/g.86067  ORF Transcript_46299/g.86067 Transcript_46299/m.86067 type:complete len:83 (+) Transcript_46299:175-423(+)
MKIDHEYTLFSPRAGRGKKPKQLAGRAIHGKDYPSRKRKVEAGGAGKATEEQEGEGRERRERRGRERERGEGVPHDTSGGFA